MSARHCVAAAGGFGTRIQSVTHNHIPKVLVDVNGWPFLEHKLRCLSQIGFTSVDLLVSYRRGPILESIRERPTSELAIRVLFDSVSQQGAAGSIIGKLSQLPEVFWITYGDSYTFLDQQQIDATFSDSSVNIMVVECADANIEIGNIVLDTESTCTSECKAGSPQSNFKFIDLRMLRMYSAPLSASGQETKFDFPETLRKLVQDGSLYALQTRDRYRDNGSAECLTETRMWLKTAGK